MGPDKQELITVQGGKVRPPQERPPAGQIELNVFIHVQLFA